MSNPLYLLKEKQDKPERVEIIDKALKQARSKIDPFTRARATYYDFMREVAKGFGGVGEGIVDLGAMTIGTVADLLGNKELSQQMQDFIKPDYVNQFYDELMPMQWIDKQFGTNTYKMAKDYFDVSYINELDDNTQQIVRGTGQAIGQVLPMIITAGIASSATQAGALSKGATLAQAISQGRKIGGLSSIALVGASASGRAGSKALNEGATMTNAYKYGVASGLLEAGVETVSGLIPGLSAIPGIGSAGKTTIGKLIGQGLSEGAEEMATELLDPLLQNLYKDAEYNVNAQEVLNSGIIGFITGSLLSGGNVVIDTSRFGAKGNKVNGYLMEINELAIEKDKLTRNGKLTVEENMRIDKEIDALYQKILEINDTMTEKDLKAYEGALGKSYEFTSQLVEETNRATGLNIDENTKYEFEPIRAENFTPEQTKKVNEVLNTMSKIQSKTKGTMKIVFTENMNVGENGAYHNNVLYININSKNPLQTAIKHELTHSIENTKSYSILKDIVLDKIKSSNQYNTRLEQLRTLYAENIQDLNEQQQTEYLEQEMVANALSEEILTDPNTINRICQTNKSLGRKILDWIKSKIKAIKNKAGIDFLRQAEKLYSQALAEKVTSQETQLATQYSLSEKLKEYEKGVKENATEGTTQQGQDTSDSLERSTSVNTSKSIQEMAESSKQPTTRSETERLLNTIAEIGGLEYRELNTGDKFITIKDDYLPKYLENIKKYNENFGLKTQFFIKSPYFNGEVQHDTLGYFIESENTIFLKVDTLKNLWQVDKHELLHFMMSDIPEIQATLLRNKSFEVLTKQEKQNLFEKYKKAYQGVYTNNEQQQVIEELMAFAISGQIKIENEDFNDLLKGVREAFSEKYNVKYSKSSTDSLGNKLTKEQQEYFKDSKVRDENGNLLVVYHGTSENFTKFDIAKSRSYKGEVDYDLPGFYFTANKQEASDYGNVKPFYLNITNPVINELNYYREQYNSWRETYDNLIEKGFDGAIVVEDGEVQEYIAFKPEQIKSIDNKNPTLNPDIRYSKSAVIGANKISTQRIQQAKKINILDWKSVVDGAKELGLQLRIGFINSAAGIVVVGNQAGVDLMPLVTYAQTSSQAGFGYIENGVIKYENGKPIQVAKSPLETLKPVLKNEAIYRDFQTYSYHKHNINRIAQGKPVFGKFLQYSTTIENQLQKYVNQNKLTQDFVDSLKATGYLDEATVNEYLANNTLDNDVKQYIESNTLDISADQSQQIVDNYEKTHPNFKSINEDIVKYFQELLKIQLESGMISQGNYDYFMQTYPNYIPTYRVMKPTSLGGATANTRGASVSTVIKKATGSDLVIETLGEGIERVTMNTIRSTRINNLARALYEIKLNDTNNEIKGVEIVTSDNAVERITDVTEIDYDEMVKHDPKSNEYTITFFVDGEKMKLRVAKSVYQGFYSLTGESKSWKSFEMIEKIMTPINTTFKKLTTSLNPIFSMWRNPTRDFGNAVLQTKFGGENLIRNIPKALNMIRKNDPMWKLYQAQGGFSSTIMDFDHGISVNIDQNVVGKAKGKLKLIGDKIEGASRTLEQLFRFTEFLMTLENGGTLTEALYNSAEVTTNFNTGGTVTKWLNRTVAPFLNPSVQGASKFIRTVAQGITPFGIASKSGVTKGTPYFKLGRVYMSKDTFRRWVNFIVQWTLFGLTASILNELLLGDDDDFKSIRDFEKDANYFIKIGDNTFFKIPKGQVIGVAGSFAQRIVRLLKGDENAFDDFLNTASQQMNPIESFRFIWQPIYEVQTNTTWYGGTIENQTLQNYKPSQRYDESTSQIAIELGKILNYSPKKIHYLIDNYTGIIGDLALPSTTLRAEGESIHILNILKKDLITDTVMSNKYSQKFYDLIEQTTYEKNEDETSRKSQIAKAKLRYLNKVNSASSEISKLIKDIQSNPNMSDKDKLAEVKVLKAQLNLLQKEALENVKLVEKNARFFELSDLSFEDDYRELTRITFGSDVALKQYNAKVYEKALALSNLGLDFDTFYNSYFDLKDISEYVSGNNKKQIVYNYINKMRIRKPLKYILYAMQGYKLTDTQLRLVKFYINTKKLSREQKDIVLQLIS